MGIEITKFLLLNVPIESDYKHTLYFNDREQQRGYFRSRMVRTFEFSSYQRKDEPIHCPTTDANGLSSEWDDLINAGVNYVMYQNSDDTTRWYYAFIKDIVYISPDTVDIHIETDCMQTWAFDYFVQPSFVEREHVSDDTVGKHTIPENLETGEYTNISKQEIDFGEMYIVVATTKIPSGLNVSGAVYGGIYTGVQYVAFRRTAYSEVNEYLKRLADEGSADAVSSVFMAPYFILKSMMDEDENLVGGTFNAVKEEKSIDKNLTMLGDYSPQNRKLYTYPYNFLVATNNNGGSAIYRYEDFEDEGKCKFNMYGAICPGGSVKMVPLNYKKIAENIEESINAGKFPICNWNTDVYTNWLTQNSVNIGLSLVQGGMQIVAGAGMMGTGAGALAGAGSIASGGMSIASTLGQVYQQSMVPPQAEGNLNCGDVLTAMGKNNISFYQRTIKGEYAEILDKYFHFYGYKVNRIKKPNKKHRADFWYTKTIDVNIDGNIPNKDLQIIKNVYNNGVTFWYGGLHVKDYSTKNLILIRDGAITDDLQ